MTAVAVCGYDFFHFLCAKKKWQNLRRRRLLPFAFISLPSLSVGNICCRNPVLLLAMAAAAVAPVQCTTVTLVCLEHRLLRFRRRRRQPREMRPTQIHV